MTESAEIVLARITVKGVVQGVGFRPFVYKLAGDHRLNGWVLNTSEGVEIEVEGTRSVVANFFRKLESRVPPLARIESLSIS